MQVLVVPSDFEFLDPSRPDIRYEQDLTDEEKERMAGELAAMHERIAASGSKPPWTITFPDGSTETIGTPSCER